MLHCCLLWKNPRFVLAVLMVSASSALGGGAPRCLDEYSNNARDLSLLQKAQWGRPALASVDEALLLAVGSREDPVEDDENSISDTNPSQNEVATESNPTEEQVALESPTPQNEPAIDESNPTEEQVAVESPTPENEVAIESNMTEDEAAVESPTPENEVVTESNPTEEQAAVESPTPNVPTLPEIRNALLNASRTVSGDAAAADMFSRSGIELETANTGKPFLSHSESLNLKANMSSSTINKALTLPDRESVSANIISQRADIHDTSEAMDAIADTASHIPLTPENDENNLLNHAHTGIASSYAHGGSQRTIAFGEHKNKTKKISPSHHGSVHFQKDGGSSSSLDEALTEEKTLEIKNSRRANAAMKGTSSPQLAKRKARASIVKTRRAQHLEDEVWDDEAKGEKVSKDENHVNGHTTQDEELRDANTSPKKSATADKALIPGAKSHSDVNARSSKKVVVEDNTKAASTDSDMAEVEKVTKVVVEDNTKAASTANAQHREAAHGATTGGKSVEGLKKSTKAVQALADAEKRTKDAAEKRAMQEAVEALAAAEKRAEDAEKRAKQAESEKMEYQAKANTSSASVQEIARTINRLLANSAKKQGATAEVKKESDEASVQYRELLPSGGCVSHGERCNVHGAKTHNDCRTACSILSSCEHYDSGGISGWCNLYGKGITSICPDGFTAKHSNYQAVIQSAGDGGGYHCYAKDAKALSPMSKANPNEQSYTEVASSSDGENPIDEALGLESEGKGETLTHDSESKAKKNEKKFSINFALGQSASLDQSGFETIVKHRDTAQMRQFLRRIISDLGFVPGDDDELRHLAKKSMLGQGPRDFESITEFVYRTATKPDSWIRLFKDPEFNKTHVAFSFLNKINLKQGYQAPLNEDGYNTIKAMKLKGNEDMDVFICRVINHEGLEIRDPYTFMGFYPWYDGTEAYQSHEALVAELKSKAVQPGFFVMKKAPKW